ncbi:outer membrane lipoprotein chaperone LolA [Acidithiobacillus sp. IBUN Pt1247-S3]|uniref:outer membrane lipoprotein chaperone LolA n=1 Tax=Acidithiobacillus sp. IBUN Pt1247-S3 TaxID=3166642 RepID=UPI0034E563E3
MLLPRRETDRVRRSVSAFLAICLVLGANLPVLAADPSALLEKFFQSSKTVTADFQQEVLNHGGVVEQKASGQLWIARPGRFRWNYTGKNGQMIVSDGQQVWLYEPALQQVTVQPLGKVLGSTPAALIAGRNVLPEGFQISALPDKNGLQWVLLKPKKGQSQGFTSIQMGFDNSGQLREMLMQDAFQQETVLHFEHVRVNVPIPNKTFHFTPPAGVDVLKNP